MNKQYSDDLHSYHTQNGVANIILYLHQNIEEEHFMKQEG